MEDWVEVVCWMVVELGGVVLLKGFCMLIVGLDGLVFVVEVGIGWFVIVGIGDVLGGVLGVVFVVNLDVEFVEVVVVGVWLYGYVVWIVVGVFDGFLG